MSPYAWELTLSRFNECVRGQLMFGYVSPADAARFGEYSEHITMFDASDTNNHSETNNCKYLPRFTLFKSSTRIPGLSWHSKQH